MSYTDNETYRCIHFAVIAIESGARKLASLVKRCTTDCKNKSTSKPSTGFLEKSKLAS